MQNFRNLQVWKKSHEFTLKIYKITCDFPREEMFGLTSQIRRASSSVATNIAEGCGRSSDAELIRFLYISMGSASESEYLILLSYDLKYINSADMSSLISSIQEIKMMLSALIKTLKKQ